ncbi:YbaY family lipoprotein [Pseudomonas sp. PDM12]|uniref:YbaY family lipoprotein n=1 Tax=Pseudomonas sp. PDM12 TaxID=2769260 RepID=UPI00178283C7|nr:YbaY family lipoprotein [Pseudomonas sp. PDM12]MBD9657263.1 YbaY family lipoprotein [Pseudomonas sp. PDM12]
MPLRPLALLCFASLLVACAGETSPPAVTAPAPAVKAEQPAPTPAHLRELTGTLLDVPAGADVELALLTINERGLPHKLLGNIQLRGTGAPLPFRLQFNPENFNQGIRVELRGRVHQSGKLVLHMPNQLIREPQSQALGEVRVTPAL